MWKWILKASRSDEATVWIVLLFGVQVIAAALVVVYAGCFYLHSLLWLLDTWTRCMVIDPSDGDEPLVQHYQRQRGYFLGTINTPENYEGKTLVSFDGGGNEEEERWVQDSGATR